jgi:hypothetical protein
LGAIVAGYVFTKFIKCESCPTKWTASLC